MRARRAVTLVTTVTDALHPARGYRWPSFQTEHGAHTPSIIEPLARDLVAWLLEQAAKPGSPIAFVAEEHFSPTLDKWARAEARRMRYEADIADHGEFDERGNQRPVAQALVTWEKRSAYHAERLGLDPFALAKIRRDRAADPDVELHQVQRELIEKYGRPRRHAAQDGAEHGRTVWQPSDVDDSDDGHHSGPYWQT